MTQDMADAESWKISEDDLAAAQPGVRALVVRRYEKVWAIVEGHVSGAQDSGRGADPRVLEIGVRVLKELSALYRLSQPPRAVEEDDSPFAGLDPAAVVLDQLAEIEERLRRASEPGPGGGDPGGA